MTREVRWERMFPDQLETAFAEKPVVYFTFGLCEPHGPQNAVGLDGLKARRIAIETARTHGGIVAPADYWHIHEIGGYALWAARRVGQVERKWLTSVPPWVHFKNVCYQIRSAEVLGFKAAILLTGHYGPNWEDLKTLVSLIQRHVRVRLYGLPDWEANTPGYDNDGASGGDHAGKVETSLLWELEPESVDLSRIPRELMNAPEDAPEYETTDTTGKPRSGMDSIVTHPYFAMGADAPHSDRRVGRRMVDDEVRWLGARADELLAAYASTSTEPGLATFEAVEQFWDSEVKPVFPSFRTMSRDFGLGGTLPEESVWHKNWDVPDRS